MAMMAHKPALRVAAGDRLNGATIDGSYKIDLLAGRNVIASDTVADPYDTFGPNSGTWHDMTASVTVGAGDIAR
jgi:hypothetical protein